MATLTVDDVLQIIQEYKGDPPDFLQKHGAWVLTIVGVGSACLGTMFAYFLKSRCKKLRFGCIECDREVIEFDAKEVSSVASHSQ